ncbi:hypothetical protein Pmani_023036 [Petrolisthes manimaculis]|uniref:Uncharacterized protein n=1 Tax=Petrolisthes manimaculis TaxID=1843537 RepID=A0AAE1U1I1_9EUCA|nr:hypothetical protein Pmani_023036 [Petrolisthes manimaculis]
MTRPFLPLDLQYIQPVRAGQREITRDVVPTELNRYRLMLLATTPTFFSIIKYINFTLCIMPGWVPWDRKDIPVRLVEMWSQLSWDIE